MLLQKHSRNVWLSTQTETSSEPLNLYCWMRFKGWRCACFFCCFLPCACCFLCGIIKVMLQSWLRSKTCLKEGILCNFLWKWFQLFFQRTRCWGYIYTWRNQTWESDPEWISKSLPQQSQKRLRKWLSPHTTESQWNWKL